MQTDEQWVQETPDFAYWVKPYKNGWLWCVIGTAPNDHMSCISSAPNLERSVNLAKHKCREWQRRRDEGPVDLVRMVRNDLLKRGCIVAAAHLLRIYPGCDHAE